MRSHDDHDADRRAAGEAGLPYDWDAALAVLGGCYVAPADIARTQQALTASLLVARALHEATARGAPGWDGRHTPVLVLFARLLRLANAARGAWWLEELAGEDREPTFADACRFVVASEALSAREMDAAAAGLWQLGFPRMAEAVAAAAAHGAPAGA